MAKNAAYGLTISCIDDADEFLSTVDGLEGVGQDLYHRFTNAIVLGPGGEEWGEDVTTWPGMDPAKLERRGLLLAEVAQRDERIEAADVRIVAKPITVGGTLYSATIDVTCYTARGPFRRVFGLAGKTLADITAIMEGNNE